MTLPDATLGVRGLVGFCIAAGTTFCTGFCTVGWTRDGDDATATTYDLAVAAAAGEVVGGRAATVVTGGVVTGIVAGVTTGVAATIAGVVAVAEVVLTTGAVVGAGTLVGGKPVPVAVGGISYFCI